MCTYYVFLLMFNFFSRLVMPFVIFSAFLQTNFIGFHVSRETESEYKRIFGENLIYVKLNRIRILGSIQLRIKAFWIRIRIQIRNATSPHMHTDTYSITICTLNN